MSVEQLERTPSEASADNDQKPKDESVSQVPAKGSEGSGAESPSTQKVADPQAAVPKPTDVGDKTAPVDQEKAIQQAMEDNPVLRLLAGKDPKQSTDKKETVTKPDAKAGKPDAESVKLPADKSAADQTDDIPQDPKERNSRFAEMRKTLKAQERELEIVKAEADFGRGIVEAFTNANAQEDYAQVEDEQLVGVVRIRAALNRAEAAKRKGAKVSDTDLAVITGAVKELSGIAKGFGLSHSDYPEPITGDLPEDWQDMVSVGSVTEKEARLFAAIQKRGVSDAEKKPDPVAKTPQEIPEAKAQRQLPPPSTAQFNEADEHTAKSLSRSFLTERGVDEKDIGNHFKTGLLPIILSDFVKPLPGKTSATTFMSMSPMARYALIEKAQTRWEAKQEEIKRPAGESEKKAGDMPLSPLMRKRLGRGLPPSLATANPTNSGNAMLKFLAGEA